MNAFRCGLTLLWLLTIFAFECAPAQDSGKQPSANEAARPAQKQQAQKQQAQKQEEEPQAIGMEIASPFMLTARPLSIQVRAGRWFPVAVTLTNTGDGVAGVLTLRLSSATQDNRTPTEFFSNVELPTNAKKRIWLYGRIERDDLDKFEVTFSGRGFKAKKAEGVIQNADPSTRIVLTISDSDEKMSYLAGLRGAGLGLPEGQGGDVPDFSGVAPPVPGGPGLSFNPNASPIRPLGATRDFVPSRWIGFDCADMVVLHDFPHSALTPAQIAALRSYAASGGSILVLGGANWQRLSSSPLADLWPVAPQSSGVAPAADASTLFERYARFPVIDAGDRLGGAPIVKMRGTLKSGCRVLLGSTAAPLLAINDFGAGQVLFLAVDPTQPPFLGWRGLPRLWADVFRPAARPAQIASIGEQLNDAPFGRGGFNPTQAQSASGALLESLATSPQLRTPPVGFIAWFLALYVFFLVPVNYVVLRYFDKRELAWVTIPVIVIAFSLMSYAAALKIKGTAVLTRQVNLVQGAASVNGSGSKWARADAMLWLFSPRKTTYDVSSADPQMVVADYIRDRSTRVAIRQPEENQAFALDGAPVNMWDWRSFVGHSVADLKDGVRLVTNGSSVGIRNGTGKELKGVVLVSHGRVWAYKSIAAGQTGFADAKYKDAVNLANAQLAGRVENASRFDPQLEPLFSGDAPKEASAAQTGFASIPAKLLNMALSDKWSTPRTFVVAWSDAPVAGMTIGQQSDKAQNLSLLVFRVESDGALRPVLARGNTSTSDNARVRLLSSESRLSTAAKAEGAIHTYEAELPSANVVRLAMNVQLKMENQYGYYDNGKLLNMKTFPLRAEIFNYQRGAWQPLSLTEIEKPRVRRVKPGQPPPVTSPQSAWKLSAALQGKAARQCVLQPDGRVQVRLSTSLDDARIKQIKIVGN